MTIDSWVSRAHAVRKRLAAYDLPIDVQVNYRGEEAAWFEITYGPGVTVALLEMLAADMEGLMPQDVGEIAKAVLDFPIGDLP